MFFRNRLKALANSGKKEEEERKQKEKKAAAELKEKRKQVKKMVDESTRLLSPFLRDVIKHYLHNDREARIISEHQHGDDVRVRLAWSSEDDEVPVGGYEMKSVTTALCLDLIHDHNDQTVVLSKFTISLKDKRWKGELVHAILFVLENGPPRERVG